MGKKAPEDCNSQCKSQKFQDIIVKQLILQHTLEFKKNFLRKRVNTDRKYEGCNNSKQNWTQECWLN